MAQSLKTPEERFTRQQVRRILSLSERQLTAWEAEGYVQPFDELGNGAAPAEENAGNYSVERRKQPVSKIGYYTFSDIIALRTLLQLRRSGVPAARLRLAHKALKKKLADVEKPWSELQIKGAGRTLTVQFNGAVMEAITGQLLLDYAPKHESDSVRTFHRASRRAKRTVAEKKAIAERFFMAALRYEEDPSTIKKAIHAYQKAIEMNPDAVGAFINLGTIYYNLTQMDAAESCYRAALTIDPNYGLVHFNLGNVFDERNELRQAREHYEEAIRVDPSYPDPHYNLALVYDKLGLHGKARQQWLRYLKLDPESDWAAHARRQLERTPLRLVENGGTGTTAVESTN